MGWDDHHIKVQHEKLLSRLQVEEAVLDIYAAKVKQDAILDRMAKDRTSFVDFISQFCHQKFGLKKVARKEIFKLW
jgi:hypothetical protein